MKRIYLFILLCLACLPITGVFGHEQEEVAVAGELTHSVFLPMITRPPLVPTYISKSYYLQDMRGPEVFDLGCKMGQEAADAKQRIYFGAVFAGQPMIVDGVHGLLSYGTSELPNEFIPLADVQKSIFTLAAAAVNCLNSDDIFIRLAVGPNNFGPWVTEAHGEKWGQVIEELQNSVDSGPLRDRIGLVGLIDAEMGFNGPEVTKGWINGYYSEESILYNMGTLDGCPTRLATQLTCGTADYPDWTLEDIVEIFDRRGARAVPQIYDQDGNNARQWSYLAAVLEEESQFAFRLLGALSQKSACEQRGGCFGEDNTPEEAFLKLSFELTQEGPLLPEIEFASDIEWQIE